MFILGGESATPFTVLKLILSILGVNRGVEAGEVVVDVDMYVGVL